MEQFIYAIDLGSTNITAVIAQYDELQPFRIKVRKVQSTPSRGIRRGVVYIEDEVARTVNALIQSMEKDIKKSSSAKTFYCLSISGLGINAESSQNTISTSDASSIDDVRISRLADWVRSKFYFDADKSIIRQNPISYDIDNFHDIASPKGFASSQLSGRYLFTLAQNKNKDPLMRLFKRPDMTYLFPLASAKASILVPNEELRNGVMLLDLGAETTNMAIYRNERLCHEASIPFGSDLITKDIASVLNLSKENAEKIKKAIGMGTQFNDNMEIDGINIEIELYKLTVRARLEEIMAYIDSEIESSKHRRYIKKIFITGGGARLNGITDFLSVFLDIPTVICNTNYKTDDAQMQQFAGALGMASLFTSENRDKLIEKEVIGNIFDQQPQQTTQPEEKTIENGSNDEDKKSRLAIWFGNIFSSNEGEKTLDE